jgi:hypothetical protein
MRFLLIFFTLTLTTTALAQQEPCGLRTMTESAAPVYPQIAKAAHVEGNIIMLVTFKTTGDVDQIKVLSGPPMLESAATNSVMTWHANEYPGPRTCPIVVRFRLLAPDAPSSGDVSRENLQHVTVTARALAIQW